MATTLRSDELLSDLEYDPEELSKDLDTLTEGKLVERIKLIENWSYELGCQEEKEMKRGQTLDILGHNHPETKI